MRVAASTAQQALTRDALDRIRLRAVPQRVLAVEYRPARLEGLQGNRHAFERACEARMRVPQTSKRGLVVLLHHFIDQLARLD